VYVASTFDGPLGIAAGLQAAAALAADGPLPPCGLATLGAFEDVEDPFVLRDGCLAVPDGPGLL
jgi:L-alanine-DL-glutamate epimerase-like enolase superfamily enzyme